MVHIPNLVHIINVLEIYILFTKTFLFQSDEATVIRKCYPAMIHSEGDIIAPRDSVLLKAGPRKNDLPFVARIAALWENPEDGN